MVPDGTSHQLTRFAWQWMWWISVYPAKCLDSNMENFVVGDVPRFKVLRYSEASLFQKLILRIKNCFKPWFLSHSHVVFILHAPWQTLGDIPCLKRLIPQICQNKTEDSSVERHPWKFTSKWKKHPRIFPPRVNEYAKTLEKARLNMGGNRMDSNLTNHGWWIRNSKGADVWLLFSVAPTIWCR